jgi:hypothetical protein
MAVYVSARFRPAFILFAIASGIFAGPITPPDGRVFCIRIYVTENICFQLRYIESILPKWIHTMSDVLLGLAHIVNHSNFILPSTQGVGGANSVPSGKAFEVYSKDWLSLLRPGDVTERSISYEKAFSYQGADNNPPDVMFRGGDEGDSFEFKKTESVSAAIALNSSFPKNILRASSPGLLNECVTCENWTSRTFYYVIGHIKKNSQLVNSLWVVDGRFMAANHETYETVFDALQKLVSDFVASKKLQRIESVELGRLRNIDTLDKTVLRVRSMWELESPAKMFSDIEGVIINRNKSVLHALILKERWDKYPEKSKQALIDLKDTHGFTLIDVESIPSPNHPDETLSGKLIRFER